MVGSHGWYDGYERDWNWCKCFDNGPKYWLLQRARHFCKVRRLVKPTNRNGNDGIAADER